MAREPGARSSAGSGTLNVELLRLRGAHNEVAALDYEPRRPRGVAVAVGHGYSSSKHNLDMLCAFLASHGFHVLSLDFPGHKLGASGGRLRSMEDLVDAMSTVVREARARHTPTVYALGHSMGAMTALRVAARDREVAGVASIATGYGRPAALDALLRSKGVVDLRSGYVDGLTLPELMDAGVVDLDATLAALAGRPQLYIAAERDMLVNRASVEQLYARAPEPKTLVAVASDHTSAGDAARGAVLGWLNRLHPRAAAAAREPGESTAVALGQEAL